MTQARLHLNPFFNRQRITDPVYFSGRQQSLEALCSAVATRQSRSVVGERKLGKSSLLTHLSRPETLREHTIDPTHFLFVYVDLEGMANIAYDEFWPEILDRLEVMIPEEHVQLRDMTSNLAAGEVRFTQVRRLFRRIERAGLTVVLMLDEFESLATNEAFSAGFYGELRSLAGELGVVYITASKRGLYDLTYRHADTLSSPFFNIFSDVPLGLMPTSEARELLSKLSALSGKARFDDAQVDLLIDLAGPHPFFLQIAGSHLYQAHQDNGALNTAALDQMQRRFNAEAEDHYRYLWSQLSAIEQQWLRRLDALNIDEYKKLYTKALVRENDAGQVISFGQAFADFLERAISGGHPTRARQNLDEMTGVTLGNYRVLNELGRGGMAIVYKGYQPSLDRYVAIKIMSNQLANDQLFVDRFQREASSVAQLRHHNIVQMHDFGVQDDTSYMVMEYIEGETLKQRLKARHETGRRLNLSEAMQIIRGIAAALDYAHAHGIVHRDVKPANIMLRREEKIAKLTGSIPFEAVLTDFGIARMLEGVQITGTGATIGTPDYMSPEQARGEPASPASDIYALGVVLYEMLTGQLPFTADTPLAVLLKHMNAKLPSARTLVPNLPAALEDVLARVLAKSAADRYPTAGRLAADLARIIQD